jgi:hypothetical protein
MSSTYLYSGKTSFNKTDFCLTWSLETSEILEVTRKRTKKKLGYKRRIENMWAEYKQNGNRENGETICHDCPIPQQLNKYLLLNQWNGEAEDGVVGNVLIVPETRKIRQINTWKS